MLRKVIRLSEKIEGENKMSCTYIVFTSLLSSLSRASNALALYNIPPGFNTPFGWNCCMSDNKRVRDCWRPLPRTKSDEYITCPMTKKRYKRSVGSHPHYAAEIWKQGFHSENTSNVFRPHYAREIWKRRFHSENASNVFRPSYSNYRSFWICVSNKLMQGNHIIIVRSSFSKSSVFKIFSVHTKRKADAFKFFLFEERFQKLDFLDGLKLRFQIYPAIYLQGL